VGKKIESANFQVHKFGATIKQGEHKDNDKDVHAAAKRPRFYNDNTSLPGKCVGWNQCSRLDLVIKEINSLPVRDPQDSGQQKYLYIIVSDLFLQAKDDLFGITDVINPLKEALAENRTIGLVAVKSRFEGSLHDLPPNGTGSLPHDGYLAFYLVLIGDRSTVRYFLNQLEKDTLNAFADEAYHYRIFSSQLVASEKMISTHIKDKLKIDGGSPEPSLIRDANFQDWIGVKIPKRLQQTSLSFPLMDFFYRNEFPDLNLMIDSKLWIWNSNKKEWEEREVKAPAIEIETKSGYFKIGISPKEFLPKAVYYLTTVLKISGDIDISEPDWIKNWSFNEADFAEIKAKAGKANNQKYHFPTLNLDKLNETLGHAALKAYRNKPIGHVAIAFSIR
jgi:hypothetical protein